MGVSGCGKSSVGKPSAVNWGGPWWKATAHHPQSVAKMQAGIALTDADRKAGWNAWRAAGLRQMPNTAWC
jgi:gluconokinase